MSYVRTNLMSVSFCVLVAGCTSIPAGLEQDSIELSAIKNTVECELAAVLRDPRNKSWKLQTWGAKSTLDLTVVQTVGADGKVTWVIPAVAAIKVVPTLGGGRKDSSIAHLEFTTDLGKVGQKSFSKCDPGPDPSQTGLGLASWINATLAALQNDASAHHGLSYTAEFEISANIGARFGYTIVNLDSDVGGGASRVGTNRLSIAIAPPAGDPEAIPVYLVSSSRSSSRSSAPGSTGFVLKKFDGEQGGRVRSVAPNAVPALRSPNIDRMLLLRAPVRIER